jgi:radical SAM protein with 4Fe4S-binding SPASM domain
MRSTVYPDTAHLMYENYLQAIDMKYYGTFFIPDSFSDFTEEQWEGYKSSLKKVADHYIKYWNDNSKKPLALNNLERIFTQCAEDIRRRELGLDIPSKTNYSRCGIGLTPGIAVSPTGDFYTCQQMTSNEEISKPFLVGNLKDGIDEEKRNNLVDLYYSQQNRKGDMDCSKCSGRSICSGGCLSTNFLIYQELRQNSPTWCRNMRALHEIGEYIVRGLNNNTAFQDFLKELSKRQKTVCEICQEEQSENKW